MRILISDQEFHYAWGRMNSMCFWRIFTKGTPVVTISENDKPICHRLPEDYGDRTFMVVGVIILEIVLIYGRTDYNEYMVIQSW